MRHTVTYKEKTRKTRNAQKSTKGGKEYRESPEDQGSFVSII